MKISRTSCALLLGLAGFVGGCAEVSTARRDAEAQPQQKADAQDQRTILNEGYSIFYSTLDGLSKFDLVFLVKSEAESVNEVTTEVTDYANTLKATLERVARDYPAVNIELEPVACDGAAHTRRNDKRSHIELCTHRGPHGGQLRPSDVAGRRRHAQQPAVHGQSVGGRRTRTEPETNRDYCPYQARAALSAGPQRCSTRSTSSTPGSGKSRTEAP